jgi:BolA protein
MKYPFIFALNRMNLSLNWESPLGLSSDKGNLSMRIRTAIEVKLKAALNPEHLEVIDNSGHHVGHAGAHPEGESHFQVIVVSKAFEGKGRVERQRMVYSALAEEMADHVHALELKTLTPQEAAA